MKNRFSTGDTVCIRGTVEGYGFNINQVPGFSYDIKNQFCGPLFRNVPEGIVFSDSEIRNMDGKCRYDKGSLIEEVEKRTGEHITRDVVYCKNCIFHRDKTACKFFEDLIKDNVTLCLNEDSYCCFGIAERDQEE